MISSSMSNGIYLVEFDGAKKDLGAVLSTLIVVQEGQLHAVTFVPLEDKEGFEEMLADPGVTLVKLHPLGIKNEKRQG